MKPGPRKKVAVVAPVATAVAVAVAGVEAAEAGAMAAEDARTSQRHILS
ncbi:MAG: hypothetical protein WAM94_02530 [Chromatiaceae bacterium]